jgi:hypothetical protein
MMLAVSFTFFMFTCYLAWKYDVFYYQAWSPPESYRNRKSINAKLDANVEGALQG